MEWVKVVACGAKGAGKRALLASIPVDGPLAPAGTRTVVVTDPPDDERYTHNLVMAAATADLAILVVDARQGMVEPTRRHTFILSLFGVGKLILAVTGLDPAGRSEQRFREVEAKFKDFAADLAFTEIIPIPIEKTPWYNGPTLLDLLGTTAVEGVPGDHPLRFPVMRTVASSPGSRGVAGTVVAGRIKTGTPIRVLPSGETGTVVTIERGSELRTEALAGESVTIRIEPDLDIGPGDVVVAAAAPCEVSDQFEVSLVWLQAEPGFVGRTYRVGPGDVRASITDIKFKYNPNSLERLPTRALARDEVGVVTLSVSRPIPFEPHGECRGMGGLALTDPYSGQVVAAGTINFALRRAQNVHRQALVVDKQARAALNGHRGMVLWFTGLSGSGKSTVANALEQVLHARGIRTYILDGDNVRHGLNKDLGFTDADRVENIRRIGEVAKLMVDAGLVVITSFISPFRSERDMARSLFEPHEFVEVFTDVPLATAEERDPKGLYKKARRGDLPNFTGIDSKYEAPVNPEIRLATHEMDVASCVDRVLLYLAEAGAGHNLEPG